MRSQPLEPDETSQNDMTNYVKNKNNVRMICFKYILRIKIVWMLQEDVKEEDDDDDKFMKNESLELLQLPGYPWNYPSAHGAEKCQSLRPVGHIGASILAIVHLFSWSVGHLIARALQIVRWRALEYHAVKMDVCFRPHAQIYGLDKIKKLKLTWVNESAPVQPNDVVRSFVDTAWCDDNCMRAKRYCSW